MFLRLRAFRKVRSWWWPSQLFWNCNLGQKFCWEHVVPCVRSPRNRTWSVWILVNPKWLRWLVELAKESQRETNGKNLQMFTWDDCAVYGQLNSSGICETQKCKSTHSPRGHENLFYASLGDGTWTTYLEDTWWQSTYLESNTWCVFVSSDFLSSFLKIDLSLSINQLHILNCKLLQLDSVELILLGRNVTSITRNWAFNNVEIWVAKIDDSALICFAHLSVAAPTVLRVDIAAGEEIRDVMLVMSPDMSTNFSFELHPSLGENLCSWSCCRTRSPCAVSNDSVPEIGAVAWTTPKLSTVKRMLRSRITLESERMLRLSARKKRAKRDILHTSSTSSKICMWMHNLIQIQSSWTHSTLNTVNNIATNANVCRKSKSHARNGIRYHVSHAIQKTEHRMLCKDNKCKNFKYPMP